jgi:hypothetical protein
MSSRAVKAAESSARRRFIGGIISAMDSGFSLISSSGARRIMLRHDPYRSKPGFI